MLADLQALETRLGYTFRDRDLLVRALTHRSFAEGHPPEAGKFDNEQLEFFGDSVLGFLVSEALVQRHPTLSEGRLSKIKAHLVSAVWLQQSAAKIQLGDFLQLGRGEERGGGRLKRSLLANALEAVIAALYLDGGLEAARKVVCAQILAGEIESALEQESANYKGELNEFASRSGLPGPVYQVIGESGPDHARTFLVEVRIGDVHSAEGSGSSKKSAAQQAARSMLDRINEGVKTGA
jgi:ribonuclease-3